MNENLLRKIQFPSKLHFDVSLVIELENHKSIRRLCCAHKYNAGTCKCDITCKWDITYVHANEISSMFMQMRYHLCSPSHHWC